MIWCKVAYMWLAPHIALITFYSAALCAFCGKNLKMRLVVICGFLQVMFAICVSLNFANHYDKGRLSTDSFLMLVHSIALMLFGGFAISAADREGETCSS